MVFWPCFIRLFCRFYPFSDDLFTEEKPYTRAEQIKMVGSITCHYWVNVADIALNFIDRMLTVDLGNCLTAHDYMVHP